MAAKKDKTEKPAGEQQSKTYSLTLPAGFKAKATLSAKHWKWEDEQPKYFRIESEMKKGKERQSKDGKPAREPATTCSVVDLMKPDSAPVTLIMGAVMVELLNEQFPNNGYIGKSFAATRYQQPGKRYKSFEVQELEKE